ncbi:unnamed protein product [Cuscuta campestris]|uniref:Uncharacterized protein n=1 Tax=Cuscuta campestris TaxID=132261 RepID=A0A484L1C4_9ASTE|nr:unnamed protein product [Cuscuta campestris]
MKSTSAYSSASIRDPGLFPKFICNSYSIHNFVYSDSGLSNSIYPSESGFPISPNVFAKIIYYESWLD